MAKFHVVTAGVPEPTEPVEVVLFPNNWDDNFRYETTFSLNVRLDGKLHPCGNVKIGQVGQSTRKPQIPETFYELPPEFFSLGQDEDYYINLDKFGLNVRNIVLKSLRDFSYDLSIYQSIMGQPVLELSIMRFIKHGTVVGRFHRLAHGNADLSYFRFVYEESPAPPLSGLHLDFEVTPESIPPTNIHVLIGRNGVGKTRCLNGMTRSLLGIPSPPGHAPGAFTFLEKAIGAPVDILVDGFVSIVFVSFSAFDAFDLPSEKLIQDSKIKYAYIGLKSDAEMPDGAPRPNKTHADLQQEFAKSVVACSVGARSSRLKDALLTLESDPLFAEAKASELLDDIDSSTLEIRSTILFRRLSSGHGIVLLTITRLVEMVDERTLVFLDEPEGHLHPPLLSAFVRALSNLLTQRNGVAIIATHSPVILQEVTSSCVNIMHRSGLNQWSDAPELETFGENVGILTREVFGLEVSKSGFHTLIAEAVEKSKGDYDAVVSHFSGLLGAEGRSLARSLCNIKRDKQ